MALWSGFSSGGTYQALSPIMAADEAINIFTETRGSGSAKQVTFYGVPGLRNVGTAATVVCRGWFEQDGLALVTVGATIYTVTFANPLAPILTSIGTIPNDGLLVSYASNGAGGDQVAIVGGGELKIYDTGTSTLSAAIALPFVGPGMVVFTDGYFLINQEDSPIVWYSALEDGTSWDALDFFARSGTSDNVVGLFVNKSRVGVLGSATSTLYYNSGDSDTPFLPFPESVTQWGLIAPRGFVMEGDVGHALMRRAGGLPQVVRFGPEMQPDVVSTPPIELRLQSATTLADAEMVVYTQAGHTFACLTCPGLTALGETPCYDVVEKQWHKRGLWETGTATFGRWQVRGLIAIGQYVYAGDYNNGDLYVLDLATYDNDGDILRRVRRAPYLGTNNQWVFITEFELGMQAGVGLSSGQGSDPQVILRLSRDGANTWVDCGFGSLGPQGHYDARCHWDRLGRVRADRLVFEVSQTDPVKTVWGPGAWVEMQAGTGQL